MHKKILYFSVLILGVSILEVSIGGCKTKAPPKKKSATEMKIPHELKDIVEINAEGEILHYREESFWNNEDFSKILKSKDEFESEEISSFSKKLAENNKQLLNPKIEFNVTKKTTLLTCDIKGAMYNNNSYDFHWLLRDLPFDLYQFKQSRKELKYEGKINGVPTSIKLTFPYSLSHCHEHVWPARQR